MNTKHYTIIYVDTQGRTRDEMIEAYGTLPAATWCEENIQHHPDHPVHIIETPMLGHMILNTQPDSPKSKPIHDATKQHA